MLALPTAQSVATILNSVTETLLGLRFDLSHSGPTDRRAFRSAVLPIRGDHVSLLVSGDRESCVALGARMFSCPPEAVDSSMIDDTLRELANIAAGALKRHLAIDEALGLPRIIEDADPPYNPVISDMQKVLLRSGPLELQVRVATHPGA